MDTANTSSSSSSNHLPWLWVVEALTEFKQVDIALLYDLMSRVPESCDESWSRSVRERLALRHLEDLFDGTTVDGDANNMLSNSESHVEVGIHFSERAEDVLSRLLKKMATSSPSKSTLECFKRDVHQFILKKRAGLPKCALQQLKDKILEGGHPYTTLLRERSGLDRLYQDNNRTPENNGVPDEAAERLEQNTNEIEIQLPKENLNHLAPDNGNEVLQEDKAEQNEVGSMDVNGICLDGVDIAAKSPKQSMKDSEVHSITEKSAPLATENTNKIMQDLPETISVSGKRVGSGFTNEQQMGCLDTDRISVDNGGFEYVISKRVKRSNNDGEIQHDQSHFTSNEGKIPQKAPSDGSHQNNYVSDTRNNSENSNKPETSRENYGNLDKAPDFDSDEEMLIAAEKRSFLISQNTFNQDSQGAEWTEQSACIKCNQGGQLLVCCVSSCPIAVHESCVGSSASFDDTGNFNCPFCSFAQATAAYRETKKKASLIKEKAVLTRKHLVKFMRMVHLNLQKQPCENLPTEGLRQSTMVENTELLDENHGSEHGMHDEVHHQEAEVDVECIDDDTIDRAPMGLISERNKGALTEGEDHQKQVNNHQDRRVVEDQEPLEGEKEATIVCTPNVSLRKKKGKAKMDEKHQSKIEGEERRQLGVHKSNASNSPRTDTRTVLISREDADVGTENSDLQQPIVDPPQESSSHLKTNDDEIVESENDDGISFEFRRRRRPAKRYSNRAFPSFRRKKVPWSAEEEEILKKGVRKFSSADEKWKKILEFGRHIFQESRTTIDLKDKWRNMTKESPRTR